MPSIYDPLTLPCGLVLPNRLSKAAMAEQLSSPDKHAPHEALNRPYEVWSEGGWGMIVTGNVQVDQTFMGGPSDVVIPSAAQRPDVEAAWKEYAAAAQRNGTPALVQLVHPGRQGIRGVGTAGYFEKRVAPSVVPVNLGDGLLQRFLAMLIFGTPRALTTEEIRDPEKGIIAQFVAGAVQAYRAGFKGIELHGAHGFLLAQFMSPRTNLRTDDYGGSAAKRVRIIVEIIQAIRAATSPGFAIGIKLNSVDASETELPQDVIDQVGLIVDAGADYIEVSGGSFENPLMSGYKHEGGADGVGDTAEERKAHPSPSKTGGIKPSSAKREAYFLEFTRTLRQHHPRAILLVTGGFRTRAGMQEAVGSGACDVCGIGRPATVMPTLPKDIILNKDLPDDKATVALPHVTTPWYFRMIPIAIVGAGYGTAIYQGHLSSLGK